MLSKLKRALKLKVYGADWEEHHQHLEHQHAYGSDNSGAANFLEQGERLQRVSPPAASLLDPFVSEAQPRGRAKQQQQLPAGARPEWPSPSSSAAALKHYAALQALQPDHACKPLPCAFPASSNDNSSMANALERHSGSRGGNNTQPLSSKDSGSKSTPSLCHAHMGTSPPRSFCQFTLQDLEFPFACYSEPTGLCAASPPGNSTRVKYRPASMSPSHSTNAYPSPRSYLAVHQGLQSDSSIPEHREYGAEEPLSHSSADLSTEKRVKFRVPRTNSLASSTGLLRTQRSTEDLGSSATDCEYSAAVSASEGARGDQGPLVGDSYHRGKPASSVDLEEQLLGIQDGHASPAPLEESLPSKHPSADSPAKLCSRKAGRLSIDNHTKAGRHSIHESNSGRLGTTTGTDNSPHSSSESEHRLSGGYHTKAGRHSLHEYNSGRLGTTTGTDNSPHSSSESEHRLSGSYHTKAGRHSLHNSSGRLGSPSHSNQPLHFRRLSRNSREGSLRTGANSGGSERRLGNLDLGPLCNSLAQLQGSRLYTTGRVRTFKELQEQNQHHHHHYHHHHHNHPPHHSHHHHHNQHGPDRRASVDQPRGPVSAAVQMMAKSSMEQHLSRSVLRKSMGDSSHAHHHQHHIARSAAHAEAHSTRRSLSL